MSQTVQPDPYTAKAENPNVSPLQKIKGVYTSSLGVFVRAHILVDLHKVLEGAHTGMMTTRASDGSFHARAMTPVGREVPCCFNRRQSHNADHSAWTENQVNLCFIANNASPKFQELQNDDHVNVSFFDKSSTNWASFSGLAKVIEDRSVIKKHWNTRYAFRSLVESETDKVRRTF